MPRFCDAQGGSLAGEGLSTTTYDNGPPFLPRGCMYRELVVHLPYMVCFCAPRHESGRKIVQRNQISFPNPLQRQVSAIIIGFGDGTRQAMESFEVRDRVRSAMKSLKTRNDWSVGHRRENCPSPPTA